MEWSGGYLLVGDRDQPTWKRLIPLIAVAVLRRTTCPRKALWMTVAAASRRRASALSAHSARRALKTGTNLEMVARAADLSSSLLVIRCFRKAWAEGKHKKQTQEYDHIFISHPESQWGIKDWEVGECTF